MCLISKMLRFLGLGVLAQALFVMNSVDTVTMCANENTVATPLFDGASTIHRLAWPIHVPSFNGLVSLNNELSLEPPTIICMNCPDPPCYPITVCDPANLFWSVSYNNVVVPPGRMTLSRTPNPPPFVAVFFTPTPPLAPASPAPLPSPSPSPSSSTHAVLVSQTQLHDDVSHCNPYDKSAIIGLSVTLSFALIVPFALFFFTKKAIKCPYCETKTRECDLKTHLTKCAEHLKLFDPAVTETVRILNEPSTQVIDVPSIEEYTEDIVARPETVHLTRV